MAVPLAGFGAGFAVLHGLRWFTEPPALQVGDFSEVVATVGSSVVLLSTTTCPWCEKTRQLLARSGIAYRDCVADRDPFARGLMSELGGEVVPRLITADRVVTGYHEEMLLDAARNAPSSSVRATGVECELFVSADRREQPAP